LKKSSTKVTVSRELSSPVTLESNTDTAFRKLSKMNKIQYNTTYSVQSVTSYYTV